MLTVLNLTFFVGFAFTIGIRETFGRFSLRLEYPASNNCPARFRNLTENEKLAFSDVVATDKNY